jgi:acetylornithine/N-succinyldiaminopimelate aminotransferase
LPFKPDVATLAKGLGSGVPIGACMAGGKAAGLFGPGNHGSTFGGNPLACTAALTTIECIEEEGLLTNADQVGALIRQLFGDALAGVKGLVEMRGHGLMIGVELDRPCGAGWSGLAAGLLINVTADTVIRLLPPLNFSENEARELVDRMTPLIKAFLAG